MSLHQFLLDYCAQKMRVLLTILAIGFACGAITVMLAVGDGLRVAFNKQITEGGVNLLVVKPGNTSTDKAGVGANQSVTISLDDFAAMKSVFQNEAHLEPEMRVNAMLMSHDKQANYTLNGVSENYAEYRHLIPTAQGRFLNHRDLEERRQVIFLGGRIAKELFPYTTDPTNKTLIIGSSQFTVVGVLADRLSFMQVTGAPDQFQAWIPLTTLAALYKTRDIADIVIQPNDVTHSKSLVSGLRQIVAKRRGLPVNDDQLLDVIDTSDLQAKTRVFSQGLEIFLGVIGTLTLAMSGVGLANVMTMAVEEATKEIGTRKAVGARTRDIVLYYLTEALLTTCFGGLIGLGFASLALAGFTHELSRIEKIKWILGDFKPTISMTVLFIDWFILLLVGIVCGCVPAKAAATIPPSEALRHEAK